MIITDYLIENERGFFIAEQEKTDFRWTRWRHIAAGAIFVLLQKNVRKITKKH